MIDEELTWKPHGSRLCEDCAHYGPYHHKAKHKGQEWVEVHECAIHPGCMNSKYSIQCPDHKIR